MTVRPEARTPVPPEAVRGSSGAAYRLLLRCLVTRGRMAALAALGLLVVVVAVAGSVSGDEGSEDAAELIEVAGLGLFAPLATLVLASAVLGDLAEDQTLVYLWMRPVARWRLALAAVGAAATTALPCVVVPLVVSGAVLDGVDLAAAAGVTGVLAVVAYGPAFVAVGLASRRALLWGLLYVLVWEGAVASVGSTLARTSIRLHLASILREVAGVEQAEFGVPAGVALTVTVAVGAAGIVATTALLRRGEVA